MAAMCIPCLFVLFLHLTFFRAEGSLCSCSYCFRVHLFPISVLSFCLPPRIFSGFYFIMPFPHDVVELRCNTCWATERGNQSSVGTSYCGAFPGDLAWHSGVSRGISWRKFVVGLNQRRIKMPGRSAGARLWAIFTTTTLAYRHSLS